MLEHIVCQYPIPSTISSEFSAIYSSRGPQSCSLEMTIHQPLPSPPGSGSPRNGFMKLYNFGMKPSSSFTDLRTAGASNGSDEVSMSDSEVSKTKSTTRIRRMSQSRKVSIMVKSENEHRRIKKCVTFADDKGMKLAQVKIMTESSSSPPLLSRYIVDNNGESESKSTKPTWKVQFIQPASQYVQFREKLEKFCLSLENVLVEEDQDKISGTVKVKNITFEKNVFVRVTYDRWQTSTDIPASYLKCDDDPCPRFDTFVFSFPTPKEKPTSLNEARMEFAVCYRCGDGREFWDNNAGDNYVILNDRSTEVNNTTMNFTFTSDYKPNFSSFDTFTTYTSWRHFSTETSYY